MSSTKTFLPVKGFRDFTPSQTIAREYLKNKIKEVFEVYGFDPIETPSLEYLEIFEGQIGEDEKLFYKFQDLGGRDVALRYDQTVPTCRYVARFINELPMPFKRYQIQPVWRAENPQKGRYREFIQCDADIFGVAGATADAEVIALSLAIYQKLGFKEVKVLINDRSLFTGIPYPVIASIDKLKKIGKDRVIAEIVKKGFTTEQATQYLETVVNLKPNETITTILNYLKTARFPDSWYAFEPTLARSFSYSTGPIWEVTIPGFEAGSTLGGERYDKMVSTFIGKDIPATGFALGFDRTFEAMEQFNLLPVSKTMTNILVTIFAPELYGKSLELAAKLRANGISTDIYQEQTAKLDRQLKYADRRGIPYIAIIGPEEAKNNTVTVKDLTNRTQETVSFERLLAKLTQ